MQYEKIILELMSRIKNLEEDVSTLKACITSMKDNQVVAGQILLNRRTKSYIKNNDSMIDACYLYGKKAYENSESDFKIYADAVFRETGMNKNSAYICIYAVKSLLDGVVFKRVISSKALVKYLGYIRNDFGKNGLKKSISALKGHIEYLQSCGKPANSFVKIYNEYKVKI